MFSKISKSTQRIASGKPGLPKFKSVASNLVSFIYNMDECDLMNKKKNIFRYLKDYDMYQRLLSEQKRSEKQPNLKRSRHNANSIMFLVVTCIIQGSFWLFMLHQQIKKGIKLRRSSEDIIIQFIYHISIAKHLDSRDRFGKIENLRN